MAASVPSVDLPEGVLVMDGGMGQELTHRGVSKDAHLWSGAALIHAPEAVRAIHEDYIRAGADLIITNCYASTRPRFETYDLTDRLVELNQLAGELACQARDACGRDVLIAGSLPPMHGTYRPDWVREVSEIEPLFREHAEMQAPYVDLFLCESMSTGDEALAAVRGAAEFGKPIWVAWTLEDGGSDKLRSGETIAEAAALLDGLPVSGFLVNCCAPESISAAMAQLAALGPWPVGGYANGFHGITDEWVIELGTDELGHRHDLTPERYAKHARDWVDAGARLIGGCCEIGPEHIARLRSSLQ